jgi:integrase
MNHTGLSAQYVRIGYDGFTLHDLRHAFTKLSVMSGRSADGGLDGA